MNVDSFINVDPDGEINKARKLSESEFSVFQSAISNLLSNNSIANFFSGFGTNPDSISVYYLNNFDNAGVDTSGSIVIGGSSFNGYSAKSSDGSNFNLSFERIMFHELVHYRLNDFTHTTDSVEIMAREQRAVFLENALYVQAFGGKERMGHNDMASGSSLPSSSYLHDTVLQGLSKNGASSSFSFASITHNIEKSYIWGDVLEITYNNYVSVSIRGEVGGILSDIGDIQLVRQAEILANSTAYNATDQLVLAHQIKTTVENFREYLGDTSLAFRADLLPQFDYVYKDSKSLSGERWVDGSFDARGIEKTNGNSPDTIALDGTSLSNAILFGSSGYHANGINYSDAIDRIIGGAGNDLLLAGLGHSSSARNSLNGGAGDDILIGNDYDDDLTGGDGNDIIYGGAGADRIDGGQGYDLVSYADSTSGVNLDFRNNHDGNMPSGLNFVVGLQTDGQVTDATGDRIINVEGIIGSSHDDTIFAPWTYSTWSNPNIVYGGDGDDNLYGSVYTNLIGGNGDDNLVASAYMSQTLSAGSGIDKLYVEEGFGEGRSVYITDGDSADRLYWNGYLVVGGVSLYVIDKETEYDENGDPMNVQWIAGALNSQYFLFDGTDNGDGTIDLSITTSRGVTNLFLDDFENGDFGLTFSSSEMGMILGSSIIYADIDNLPTLDLSENGYWDGYNALWSYDPAMDYAYQKGAWEPEFLI